MPCDTPEHCGSGADDWRTCCETSNLQGGIGLNVCECEYCGLTHGAAHGLGLRSCMAKLGFEMSLEILSDSSAPRAFASRRGLGRQRHKHDIYGFRNDGSRTSLNTKDHNHAQHCGHFYKGSKQRNIGTTQENNWTKTWQRTQ